jgi:hypothetical protein
MHFSGTCRSRYDCVIVCSLAFNSLSLSPVKP